MPRIDLKEIRDFVENNIGKFHDARLDRLEKLELNKILKRKNPYLFKAKNILRAQDLIQALLDAHLSSQEETLFGDFLEMLAIFINGRVYGGKKSSAEGIDLEFDKNCDRYLVSIKSGPNWGNSSQIKRMIHNFKTAAKILRTSGAKMRIVCINGCCYGQDSSVDKTDYFKYCGQRFWEFISGNTNLYTEIVEPLGHKAKQKNDAFNEKYSGIINKFTSEFIAGFCRNGTIDWKTLICFNSSTNSKTR